MESPFPVYHPDIGMAHVRAELVKPAARVFRQADHGPVSQNLRVARGGQGRPTISNTFNSFIKSVI